jgi:hypothetical protein
MKEPVRWPMRWIDDPEASAELRRDLARSAQSTSDYDVAGGLSALQAALSASGGAALGEGGRAALEALASANEASANAAANAAAGASATAGGVTAGAAVSKLAAVSVLGTKLSGVVVATAVSVATAIGVATAGAYLFTREPARSVPKSAAAVSASAPASTGEATPAPTSTASSTAATRSSSAVPSTSSDVEDELAQLVRIKALLDHDPHAALSLCRMGDARFPKGLLRQERTGLSVLALEALGEEAQARAQARKFLSTYPKSPLRERLAKIAREPAP